MPLHALFHLSPLPDQDYNSTSHFITLRPGDTEISVEIDIFDDKVSEFEEVFLVYLKRAKTELGSGEGAGAEKSLVTLNQDIVVVRITESSAYLTSNFEAILLPATCCRQQFAWNRLEVFPGNRLQASFYHARSISYCCLQVTTRQQNCFQSCLMYS